MDRKQILQAPMNRAEVLSKDPANSKADSVGVTRAGYEVRLLCDISNKPDDDPELVEARKLSADTKLGKRPEE